jgi:hypothetical protein
MTSKVVSSAEAASGPKNKEKFFVYFCMKVNLSTPDFDLNYKIKPKNCISWVKRGRGHR